MSLKISLEKKYQNLNNAKKILIIGPLYDPTKAENFPRNAFDFYAFIDGGAHFVNQFTIVDHQMIVVGDGDSYQESEIIFDVLLNPKKDLSDLAFFLSLPMKNVKELTLMGFRGGRLDHELINIGELYHFVESSQFTNLVTISLLSSQEVVKFYPRGCHEIHFQGKFSLLTLITQNISISGDILYSDEQITLRPLSSRGLSNESSQRFKVTGEHAFIIIFHKIF